MFGELVGISVILYYLFYLIFPCFLDCDIKLFFISNFGQPIESLKGKVVWIVGASSGIGEYLSYELAKVECKLILSARRVSELQKVKNNCLKINANLKETDIHVLEMDVCDTNCHKLKLDSIIEKLGKLDILVNNAGRSQRAEWEKIDLEVDKEVFQLNVFSVISLTRLAYKYFVQKGQGHIVATSSLAGIMSIPFSGSYTASKHALHGYYDSLRMEKMNKNIPITLVCPGAVATPLLGQSFTANLGEKFNEETDMTAKNKLSAERCAYLMAVSIANRVNECWLACPAALQLTYCAKYYPNLTYFLIQYVGPKFIQRLRDNRVTVK